MGSELLNRGTRKITINGQVYIWNYTDKYNRIDDTYISRLFFSPQDRKNISVECFFKTTACFFTGCHLNVGFSAIKNGEEYEINFNHPGFISEMMQFILNNKVDFLTQERYFFDDAFAFLKEMGYESIIAPYKVFSNE